MKRLLTGVLTLATVFTTLPVTQVHAADSVYTTTDGKAGTIVKIDNGGSEVSSFEESIMNADGQIAYCIDINTNFQSGYKNRINATERMSDDQISDVALNLEYVKQYAEKHSLSSKQVYLLKQCVVWRRLSVHLGWGYNNVRAAYDEVSEKIQSEVYENAKAFAKENKDRYDCGGYIYVGEGQDLGQFWAKLAVGDGKIQKSSSNTTITKSNDCYSLSGATYGVYSDKGCTKSVATLTTDGNGNTDTVELRAATYYIKEIEAPKGFQLDKNTYTLTVKAGETATLKVSDTPKVTDTLVELFKNNTMTFVAGSSWQPDEDLFIEYFNQHPEVKLVIAPHVIDENHLVEIIRKLKRPYVRYTRADEKNVRKADCLIIDCFGLLSSIYRYGEIAYIGGGFGVGIHNTLEAAVYGIPVIFGPKYQKFQEAIQLLEAKGAFSVKDYEELKTLLDRMLTDEVFLRESGMNASNYVTGNAGATDKIMSMINF